MLKMKWLLLASLALAGCGVLGGGGDVSGYPEVDLGAPVEVYKSTSERDLHIHLFEPESASAQDPTSAVLFFHGGGYATTRVPQFERQAQAAADAGMIGIVVEYRVRPEGTTRADAIQDGVDAAAYVLDNAERLGVDPQRIALAGSSAGGDLAVHATDGADVTSALVLFNPAVNPTEGGLAGDAPTIVFHSREDVIVRFESADGFCNNASACQMVAFDEGAHGFFNDEPAFTETTEGMVEFLQEAGW